MAKIYLKWQKWDNIVSDLFLIIKTKISKIFNFKDKIVYQITFRKKKQSALGGWTQLAWAQVHYSNHYATGTLASRFWRFKLSKIHGSISKKYSRMRGSIFKKSYSAFIKAFLTTIKNYLIYKTVEKNRDFLYHPMTTENNSKRSDRALQI